MAVTADPLWINANAGAPAYSANELRQAMALAMQYNGRTLGARAGVRPGGNALQTSIAGSTITVRAGVACVDPALTTAQGPYWVCLPADDTFTLTAAHATLPRKDITILRVYDHDEDSSGLRKAQAEYLTGTAASSPSEPSVPAGSFRLSTIDVPASGGGSPSVTLNYPFTVAAGGVLPVRNVTERGAITPFDGFAIYRQDRKWIEIHDDTAWRVQGVAICTTTGDRDGANGVTNPVAGNVALCTSNREIYQYEGAAWIPYRQIAGRLLSGVGVQYTTSGTTELDLTKLAIENYRVKNGGWYIFNLKLSAQLSVAADSFVIRVRKDTALSGTVVAGSEWLGIVSGFTHSATVAVPWQASADDTDADFYVSAQRVAGSGTLALNGDERSAFWIDDRGGDSALWSKVP